MTSLRLVLQYKDTIGAFAEKFDLKVVGVRVVEGVPHFLFDDGEYYTKKAMRKSITSC